MDATMIATAYQIGDLILSGPDHLLLTRPITDVATGRLLGHVEDWTVHADKQTRAHAHDMHGVERRTYRLTGTLFFTAYYTDDGDDKHLFWHLREA